MTSSQATRFPLWFLVGVLAAGAFTTALNVTLLSPLLPLIAEDFGISEATAGQLGTLTAIVAGLTAIIATPLIDRYSRRVVLQLESVLLFLATVISVLAPNFAVLAASRMLAGLGGAIIFGICLAAAADLFPNPAQRNRAIGLISSAATLGTVVGLPVLTQIGDLTSWRWAIGVLLPFAAILFIGALGLPRRAPRSAPAGSIRQSWLAGYRVVWQSRATVALLLTMTTLAATWFAWLIYFGAFAQIAVGVSAGLLSLLFLAGGGAEIVANNAAPLLLQRFPVRPLALTTTVIMGLCLLGVGVIFAEPSSLFAFMVIASATSVLIFLFLSITLLDSLPTARGAVMALQSASFETGGAIGISGMGLALVAMAEDYAAAYRLVGVVTLVVLIPLAYVACRPRASAAEAEPEPEPAVVPTA